MPIANLFSRYNDYYLPIGTHPKKRPNLRMLLLAVMLIASLVVNLVVFIRYLKRVTNPLDDYQELKRYPLVNASMVRANVMSSNFNPNENAIVTTLYSDAYAPAVAALGHSLNKVNPSARLIVLYIPSQVSASALCLATASGFTPHPVHRIPPPHNGTGIEPRFSDQYTKLTLWTLDTLPEPVRALVYIDADALVLRNFDELFSLPYHFAAVPDVYGGVRGFTTGVNAGVMFLRPDSKLFRAMVDALPQAKFPPTMAEQAFFNQYFATDVLRLPYAYNGNLALKQRSPHVWSGIKDEMRIIHYTLIKPFITKEWGVVSLDQMQERVKEASGSYGGLFHDEMSHWGNVWEETRTTYAQRIEGCSTAIGMAPAGQ